MTTPLADIRRFRLTLCDTGCPAMVGVARPATDQSPGDIAAAHLPTIHVITDVINQRPYHFVPLPQRRLIPPHKRVQTIDYYMQCLLLIVDKKCEGNKPQITFLDRQNSLSC